MYIYICTIQYNTLNSTALLSPPPPTNVIHTPQFVTIANVTTNYIPFSPQSHKHIEEMDEKYNCGYYHNYVFHFIFCKQTETKHHIKNKILQTIQITQKI